MYQVQHEDPEQHAPEAHVADNTVIHLVCHGEQPAPAMGADEWQHALDNEYERDGHSKYLPKIQITSQTTAPVP
jgi:hypothetical protein